MKEAAMRYTLFALVIVLAITDCENFIILEDSRVELNGVLRVTENGVPYTGYIDMFAQWDGGTFTFAQIEEVSPGTYTWTASVSPSKKVYFEAAVFTDQGKSNRLFKTADKSVKSGIINQHGIDLGEIAFNTIGLSGSVPVTLHGEKTESAKVVIWWSADDYNRAEENYGNAWAAIDNNGDWSVNIPVFSSETPLTFCVETEEHLPEMKSAVTFRKELGPLIINKSEPLTFPPINFESVSLSGTLKINNVQTGPLHSMNLEVYQDVSNPYPYGFNSFIYSGIEDFQFDGQAIAWSTLLQAVDLPAKLAFRLSYMNGDYGLFQTQKLAVTGLSDIALEFTIAH
jgi:hypothetical protein